MLTILRSIFLCVWFYLTHYSVSYIEWKITSTIATLWVSCYLDSFQQPLFEPFLWDNRVENMFPSTPLILWQFCYELSFSTTTMPYTWRFLEVTILRKIRHAPRLIKRIQNKHPRIIGDSQMTVWKIYVSEVIFIGRERKLKNEENGTQENMLFFVTQYHQDLAKPRTIPTGNGSSLKANRTK